ncbi:MAG: DUF4347 domain-containing protein, partial [Desulfuromonadales bacterium]
MPRKKTTPVSDIFMRTASNPFRPARRALALEPRLLFDGAAGVLADAFVSSPDVYHAPDISHDISKSAPFDIASSKIAIVPVAAAPVTALTREIVFIDSTVRDWQQLAAGIDPGVEIILLDASRDGVNQMADALSNRHDISAVHIISHGNSGGISLGNAALSAYSLTDYASDLARIGSGLTADGDILLYGCDVAKGEDGSAFLSALAAATGADVAASENLTGAAKHGGDWVLEKQAGSIEARSFAAPDYQDVLAATTVSSLSITSTPAGGAATGFTVGETVKTTVVFSAAETVTGTPTIDLNVGGNIRTARYVSGSGTANLVFDYTVVAGDVDANGIAIVANSLKANNGSINNGADAATITHAAVADNAAKIIAAPVAALDVTAPVFRSAVGSGSTLTISYDEFGSGLNATAPPVGNFTFVRNGGAGGQLTVTGVSVNHAANTVSLSLSGLINTTDSNMSVTYTANGTNDIQDIAGNKVVNLNNVFVANAMPTFDAKANMLAFNSPSSLVRNGAAGTEGRTAGDKVLYSNIITVDGQSIDAVVSTTTLTSITIGGFDTLSGTAPATLTGTPASVEPLWFELNTSVTGANGAATIDIYFIKSGSYNAANLTTSKGVDVVLQNVAVNSYDIDAAAAGQNQFQEFGGFATYTVSSTSTLAQTQQPGYTHFQDTSGANTAVAPGTAAGDNVRVMALYDAINGFSIKTGAIAASTAYYYIDFSKGPNWFNAASALTYNIPTVNPRVTNDTTPTLTGTFYGNAFNGPTPNASVQAYTLTVTVNGVVYRAGYDVGPVVDATERTVAGNIVTFADNEAGGLTGTYDSTTGLGTWTMTVAPTTLALGTYDVAVDVGYGASYAAINKHTVDDSAGELVINGTPADVTAPTMTKIERLNPINQNITSAALAIQNYVDFNVTFSEAVTNVDGTDFQITGTASSGATISSVTQTGATTYTVRVSGIPSSNTGTLDLNLLTTNNLVDLAGNNLGNLPANVLPTSGTDETYTISAHVTGTTGIAAVVAGQTITLTVTDADLNTNAGTAQTTSVTVTNNATGETETVTLTETGINTGIFSGTLASTTGAGGGNNSGTLNVASGNTIKVDYIDALDATGAVNQTRTASTVATAGITGTTGIAAVVAGQTITLT